jgi:hypothetical protein
MTPVDLRGLPRAENGWHLTSYHLASKAGARPVSQPPNQTYVRRCPHRAPKLSARRLFLLRIRVELVTLSRFTLRQRRRISAPPGAGARGRPPVQIGDIDRSPLSDKANLDFIKRDPPWRSGPTLPRNDRHGLGQGPGANYFTGRQRRIERIVRQ